MQMHFVKTRENRRNYLMLVKLKTNVNEYELMN